VSHYVEHGDPRDGPPASRYKADRRKAVRAQVYAHGAVGHGQRADVAFQKVRPDGTPVAGHRDAQRPGPSARLSEAQDERADRHDGDSRPVGQRGINEPLDGEPPRVGLWTMSAKAWRVCSSVRPHV